MSMNNWMSQLAHTKRLVDICMPGSHDASLYAREATGQGLARLNYASFICQDRSIGQQCQSGSRFFDIRLTGTDGKIRGYHTAGDSRGILAQGGLGAQFEQILDDVYYFLKANKTEFVILRFSHTHETTSAGNVINVMMSYIAQLNNPKYDPDFILQLYKGCGENLAGVQVRSLRGKLVCIFDTKEFASSISPPIGIHAFRKHGHGGGGGASHGLSVCGEFSNKGAMTEVEQKQNERIAEHTEHTPGDHLFQLYWTQSKVWDIEKETKAAASGAHATLVKKLVEMRRFRKLPNVVLYDFVNDASSSLICGMNF